MRLDQQAFNNADLFYPTSGDPGTWIHRPTMPAPTTMTMPSTTATAQATTPNPQPQLAPMDLIRPLPSIVNNQPVQIAQCDTFTQWVGDNPVLAGGILVGLWMFLGRSV